MSTKAVHIDNHFPLSEVIKTGNNSAGKFQADGNADIQAKGADMLAKANEAQKAADKVTGLQTDLATAVINQTDRETDLISSFNSGVDKANEIYPHDDAVLKGLGLTLSKDHKDLPVCDQPVGCSVVQSEHSGKANTHWHSLKNAKSYMVMETTSADTMDEKNYYPANPVSFDNSKGGEVVPKQLGVITWWRIYGHNAAGDGVWSAPFGGFPVH